MKILIKRLSLVSFLLISIVAIYMVSTKNQSFQATFSALTFLSLLVFYVINTKKINLWYLIALIFLVIADFIFYEEHLYYRSVATYFVTFSIYSKLTIDIIGKIPFSKISLPLLFFGLFLSLMLWIIKDNIGNYFILIFIYGLLIIVFAALSFFNYLEKSSKTNRLLFLGACFMIVNNTLAGLDIFGVENVFIRLIRVVTYIYSHFFICLAFIQNLNFRSSFKKQDVFQAIFFVTVIIGLVSVLEKDEMLISYSIPVIFISLIGMYLGSIKQVKILPLLYLIFIFFGEVILLLEHYFFKYALVLSVVSQIVLIFLIYNYKTIKLKNTIVYFLIVLVFYLVICKFVLNIQLPFVFVGLYILVDSLMISFALKNYLEKMYKDNYLLFSGVFIGFLNTLLISYYAYGSVLNVYEFVTNVFSHYLICSSFIFRQQVKTISKEEIHFNRDKLL